MSVQGPPVRYPSAEEVVWLGRDAPLFPCAADKRPRTAHGFHDATADETTITRWWTDWPQSLVAIPTGAISGRVVLDVDPENLTDASREWLERHTHLLTITRSHTTQRGGWHFIYQAPEGVTTRCCAGIVVDGVRLPGIDIRGDGGYVIWWPAHGLAATGEIQPLPEALLPVFVLPRGNGHASNGKAPPESASGEAIGPGGRNEYLSREAFRLRKQGSTVEQINQVLRALNEARCRPPLDAEEVRQIARGKEHVSSEGSRVGGQASEEPATWPDLLPLEDALPAVEAFEPELLPDSIRPWVLDISERMQAPVEYVAAAVMTELGAILGRKVAMRPKQLDDWIEFANVWAAVIGPPSWMKSPALGSAMEPLARIETNELASFESTHREWAEKCAVAEVKRVAAKQNAIRAAKQRVTFTSKDLVEEDTDPEPQAPRLIVNDATVPALCKVLRGNPNGVLVYRDELSGLIAELDREGMEGSRAFYLSGWSGKEGYVEDRIGRGTNLRVPHVCLSLLGGIQPTRIGPLLRESLATGGSDGFLARFSLLVWPDNPGTYQRIDREPDTEAYEHAWQRFRQFRNLDPAAIGAECIDGRAPFLRLEPTAGDAFAEWDVELRNRLRSGSEDAAVAAHLGKYPKMVCALALICHLADDGIGPVTQKAIERAIGWAELLEMHAKRVYASLGQAHVDAARALLRRLRKAELGSPFRVREVYRRGWAQLGDRESAQAAADLLEARGHLVRREIIPLEAGGRPTVEYWLNPAARAAS